MTGTSKKPVKRSKFEDRVDASLKARGVIAQYETVTLHFVPAPRRYKPDFLLPNGIFIEAKGWFKPADRTKMLAVQAQHPDKDIRLLFQDASKHLSKQSQTTYGEWATKHGFTWAEGDHVPDAWLNENNE